MAPYAPSNNTLVPSEPAPSPCPRDLLPHRSSSVIDSTSSPSSAILPDKLKVAVTVPEPHVGVGPVMLQPSPSHTLEAQANASVTHRDTSPQLAYIAILAIPLVAAFVLIFLMRRGKQKPAKKIAQPQQALRNEAVRARADTETSRIQQLPRDRIRAMNSVPRDQETAVSPPADHQIFSPRPPSASMNDHPHPLGSYFTPLSVPGFIEPPSPLTTATSFATNISSCPPTPFTPTFAVSSMSPPHAEIILGSNESETEEGRFTWDFKCKGNVKRLSCVSAAHVLDTSNADNAVTSVSDKYGATIESHALSDSEGAHRPTEATNKTCNELTVGSPAGPEIPRLTLDLFGGSAASASPSDIKGDASFSASQGKRVSVTLDLFTPDLLTDGGFTSNLKDRLVIDSVSVPDAETPRGLKSQLKSDKHFSTCSGLTILDLDLDDSSFSAQVIDALSSSSNCVLQETTDRKAVPPVSEIAKETPLEHAKMRPVLSRPNHRTLSPSSPNLKSPIPSDVVDHAGPGNFASAQATAIYLSEDPLGLRVGTNVTGSQSLYLNAHARTGVGRNRASSESSLNSLRKSLSMTSPTEFGALGTLACQTGLSEIAVGGVTMNAESGVTTCFKGVSLRSSLSMPIAMELACFHSFSRRFKAKHD